MIRALWTRLINRHVDVDENGMTSDDYLRVCAEARGK